MPDKPPSLAQFDDFDFRELPIGVYMTSLDGQFIVANRIVRKMLELPLDGKLSANFKDFYANPTDRDVAIEEAKKLAEQGKNVERGILHLKVRDRELYVEDYCRIVNCSFAKSRHRTLKNEPNTAHPGLIREANKREDKLLSSRYRKQECFSSCQVPAVRMGRKACRIVSTRCGCFLISVTKQRNKLSRCAC